MYTRLPLKTETRPESKNLEPLDNLAQLALPSTLWLAVVLPCFTLEELAYIARYLPSMSLQYLNDDQKQFETLMKFADLNLERNVLEAQQNGIAGYSNQIMGIAKTRQKTLQEIEDKRLIKKSTYATVCSLVPGFTLISISTPLFLAASNATPIAKSLISSTLYPTCKNTDSDTLSLMTDQIMWHRMPGQGESKDTCAWWRDSGWWAPGPDMQQKYFQYGCDYDTCMNVINYVIENIQNNNWPAGWMTAAGIATILIATCLYFGKKKWETLNQINLEDILAKPFHKLVNEDFSETIREFLQIDPIPFSRLTVRQVIENTRGKREVVNREFNKLMMSPAMKTLQETLKNKTQTQKETRFFQSVTQPENSECKIDIHETKLIEEKRKGL